MSQGLYDQVRAVFAVRDWPEALGVLVPGGQDEARWLIELWEIAQGREDLETFLTRHGFHGPLEGELSSPSWRVNVRPLTSLFASYATSDREPPG